MKRTGDHPGERGFAMLLVFLMAAIIAISLYMEIPRVAFESQRAKEELLISRGEQYKRAIKVFVAANKRYPASIEELESFNNHRYLRKRFVDPMTGKKEWRLVHIGPGGVFTDSLVNKPKNDQNKDGKDQSQQSTQNFTDPSMVNGGNPAQPSAGQKRRDNELAALCGGAIPGQTMPGQTAPGQTPPGQGQPIVPAIPVPGMPAQPGATGMAGMPNYSGVPGMPGAPGSTNPCPAGPMPGQPGYTGQIMPGQPGYPGSTYPGSPYPGATYPGQPGYVPGQQPGMPGQVQPGMPGGVPGMPSGVPGMPGMPPGSPYSTTPGPTTPGANTAFGQPGTTPNPTAQQMIQNLLTQPRPGGFPGQPMQASGMGGSTIGGGIAGFASKDDEEGIKVYNDHTNYKEWEFIYDYTKDTGVAGTQGANGTPVSQMGQQPGQQPQSTSSFGGIGGSTPGSSFGQGVPGGAGPAPSPFGSPPAPPPNPPQ